MTKPCCNPPIRWCVPFMGFTAYTPTIPKLYWDTYSQEQRIHALCEEMHKIVCYADYLGQKIELDHTDIEALKAEFEEFKASGFEDYYEEQLTNWINENAERLIAKGYEHVYFGLTDDGYFCAYVPESWSDIEFDTGAIYGRSDYGRLILRMNVDGEGVIDNTYSYSLNARPSAFERLISDLEVNTHRTDASYDTLFTNLNEEVIINGRE